MEDRAKVAAVATEKASRCTSCGTAEWEWEEDPYAYAPARVTCRGCMLREIMQEDDTPTPKGTSVRLLPKEQAQKLAMLEAEGGAPRPTRRRS